MRWLETERLIVRPIREDDHILLGELLADARVMERFMLGRPLDSTEAMSFVSEHFTEPMDPLGFNVVCMRGNDVPIGMAGIEQCGYLESSVEFGWAMHPDWWGRGLATEIGREQIRYAFEELQLSELYALAHPENLGSNRVIAKLGLLFERRISTPRGPRNVYCVRTG